MGGPLTSFIYSSKLRSLRYIALTVLLSITFICILDRWIPSSFKPIPELKHMVLKNDQTYLQYNDVSLDNYVFLYGMYDTIKEVKQADVLLLGSSRLGYALQDKNMQNFDFRPYVMAFGNEEMDLFPMKIIRKFDLHPKLFVINVDEFFENNMSKYSQKVVKEGLFSAYRTLFEYTASTLLQNEMHQHITYFAPFFTHRPETILVRSKINGTWHFLKQPQQVQSLTIPSDSLPTAEQLQQAQTIVTELKNKGSEVVFVLVPNPKTPIGWATELARQLGVPFWPYSFEGVQLRDPSHISEEEGEKFTSFLMNHLEDYFK